MAPFADVRQRLSACTGCRRRRAMLRAALNSVRRRFGGRNDDRDIGGAEPAPDFGRWFLVVEHIDAENGTATFRLNGREDEGYRLGLPIPLDRDGRPAGPDLLVEAMAAEAVPTVRRELAGAGPPDFGRLKPLEGRKIDIAHFIARHIERHYRCEDCRHG
ncbi:MAG: hypothetical protein F4114_15905 [Rhodospirillaceae bacterium]|nr:hypothetical protein [Rhodospirillaceae bacterium]MYB11910.1 hypothetical protein [Rhodospirillaceae bacterium]MYI50555.1 hypothetical protein [Rhodospirillaceae bacterium]